MPGVAQGDALQFLQNLAARTLPQGYSVDYGGLSRQYVQESSGFVATFGFALIIIFLALAALFESFRDPVIILVSVPMSIAGALIFIALGFGGTSLNIYTEVGLVTLMGLISKHGILIVEFANQLQEAGRSKREAIEQAAGIRLRPILMTTAAMVLGVVPLIIASGAGAVSRFHMGLVIASRPLDRHAVHAVRGAGGLSVARGRSSFARCSRRRCRRRASLEMSTLTLRAGQRAFGRPRRGTLNSSKIRSASATFDLCSTFGIKAHMPWTRQKWSLMPSAPTQAVLSWKANGGRRESWCRKS